MKYGWYTLYWFQVYYIVTQQLYTAQDVSHNSVVTIYCQRYHQNSIISSLNILFCLLRDILYLTFQLFCIFEVFLKILGFVNSKFFLIIWIFSYWHPGPTLLVQYLLLCLRIFHDFYLSSLCIDCFLLVPFPAVVVICVFYVNEFY